MSDGTALIGGLSLEGARWDEDRSCLADAAPMALYAHMPILQFKPRLAATSTGGVDGGVEGAPSNFNMGASSKLKPRSGSVSSLTEQLQLGLDIGSSSSSSSSSSSGSSSSGSSSSGSGSSTGDIVTVGADGVIIAAGEQGADAALSSSSSQRSLLPSLPVGGGVTEGSTLAAPVLSSSSSVDSTSAAGAAGESRLRDTPQQNTNNASTSTTRKDSLYRCPLYMYPGRAPCVFGSAVRDSFITAIDLPSGDGVEPAFWVKRGVALLSTL